MDEIKKDEISYKNNSAIRINNAGNKNEEKKIIYEPNSLNKSNNNFSNYSNDSSTFDNSKSYFSSEFDNNISTNFSVNNNQNEKKKNSTQ